MTLAISYVIGLFTAIGALIGELLVFSVLSVHQESGTGISVLQKTGSLAIESSLLFLFLSACVEEVFKYVSLKKIFSLKKQISFPALVSFGAGFSSLEMLLLSQEGLVLNSSDRFPIAGIAILHVLAVCVLGYSLYRKAFASYALLILVIFLHFAYNIAVLRQNTSINILVLIILLTICVISLLAALARKKTVFYNDTR